MLASKITNLAGLGLGSVARGDLATTVRVEVSLGTSAVTVGRDGLVVNVVSERAFFTLESRKLDGDVTSLAVGTGNEGESTSDTLGTIEGRGVASKGEMSARCIRWKRQLNASELGRELVDT